MAISHILSRPSSRLWLLGGAVLLLGAFVYSIYALPSLPFTYTWNRALSIILIGLAVQSVGTAYSLITTAVLLSMGTEPLMATATVHIVSIFTAGTASISHWQMGNVNRKLAKTLLWPGIVGVLVGVSLATVVDGKLLKPFVTLYLLVMGLLIIYKTLGKVVKKGTLKGVVPFALTCGALDAMGGGGWGAITTTTLLSKGKDPRYTLGTVNFTKFFVTLAAAIGFIGFAKLEQTDWELMLFLVLGGIPGSYLAAFLCSRLPGKMLMRIVALIIILLSVKTIIDLFLA
jgi:uncharacterized membrane protein YfcA